MTDALAQLATLYREHGRDLLAYLRRASGAFEPAEDLLQETLLQAARRPTQLVQARSPRAWLFAIARRAVLRSFRRGRRRLTSGLPADLPAAAPAPDPRIAAMRAAIAELAPGQREVLELRLVQVLSYEEIAHVLDIPVGTVRSRLHYAVRALRARLAAEDVT